MRINCDQILEIIAKEKGLKLEQIEIVLDHDEMQFYIEIKDSTSPEGVE